MNKIKKLNENYIFFLALMTALAASLYMFEMYIPKPLPFMKIGFSNIVVLVLVYSSFFKEAVIVAISKSLIGSFISGTLFSPTFLLSIFGSLLSCVIMMGVMIISNLKVKNRNISPLPSSFEGEQFRISIFGLSIVGSFVHLLTQLIVVRIFIIQSDSILLLYPLIAVISIVTGFLTGLCGFYFNKTIDLRSYYAKAYT
ncbi:MAG: Gx transporter family protein [Candidatus Cloacimonetes bacterium]|nr:Gx transporter family protein [Candidatus Cloacimonadota bacterium]